jgi:hypothetical protein
MNVEEVILKALKIYLVSMFLFLLLDLRVGKNKLLENTLLITNLFSFQIKTHIFNF